ncbi:MAG: hypothetical protein ACWA5U_08430 [bacterium]
MDCIKTLNDLLGRFPQIAIAHSPRCFINKRTAWKAVLFLLSSVSFSALVNAKQTNNNIDLGSWLDQAAMACEQKNKEALKHIQTNLRIFLQQYPPLEKHQINYINSLFHAFRAGHCKPFLKPTTQQPAITVNRKNNKPRSELRMALSHVTNVNLGSRHPAILVKNPFGEGEIELVLNDESLPKSDTISELALSHWYELANQWDAQLLVYHQNYQQHNEFDLSAINLKFSKKFLAPTGTEQTSAAYGRYQFGVQGVWLDNMFWQQKAEFAVSQQWAKTAHSVWSTKIKLSYQHYPERSQYDALDSRVKVSYQHELSPQQHLHLEGELGYDAALNERAGGDRPYVGLGLGFKQNLGHDWHLTSSAKIRLRNDQKPYNSAFFAEQQRQQRLTWLNLNLEKAVNKHYTIGLSYSRSQNDDAGIALFDAAENQRIMLDVNYHW